MARIALLGGTFDPPHDGHLALARGVADALGLDRVVLMPTGIPNFKQDVQVSPAADRLAMTRLLCREDARLQASSMEIDRGGVTYTADTLEQLLKENPGSQILFVVGGDCLGHIMTWRRAADIARLCTVVGVARPGFDFSQALKAHETSDIRFDIECVEVDTPDVSSTQVRRLASQGCDISGLVPQAVATYIREHSLYG